MGGRGTYSKNNPPVGFAYKTVDKIEGIKVLMPVDEKKQPKLPEESKSSSAYVLYNRDGKFVQYREYNKNHEVVLEIGYHHDSKLTPKGQQARDVLHVHFYDPPGVGNHGKATVRVLYKSDPIYHKYKFLFKGVVMEE